MPIKDISIPVAKAKKGTKTMPTVTCDKIVNVPEAQADGSVALRQAQLLTEFNKARQAFKDAEARMKELEPMVKETGVREWIKANVENAPGEPVSSIKLVDLNGSETRVTGMDKYPIADAEPVSLLFDEVLQKDVNEFVQFTLKASFNSKVFLDANGDFQKRIYESFKAAVDQVAKKLNVPTPLDAVKVLQPKPSFHKDRWAAFNVVQNSQIFGSLPNTITLSPLVTNEPTVTPEVKK